jgi:hypothetical protein
MERKRGKCKCKCRSKSNSKRRFSSGMTKSGRRSEELRDKRRKWLVYAVITAGNLGCSGAA